VTLLAVVTLWMVTPSCRSPQTQKPQQNQASENPADANEVRLTRQQVIEIANAEIRRNGMNPADYDVIFDQGNLAWRSVLRSVQFSLPELEGRDYQVVKYTPRGHKTQGSDLFVFVDKNTGKALLFLQVG
jgi:hypothetical protein